MSEPPRLCWRVHLAAERPRQALGAVAVVALGTLAAGYGFQSWLLGVLAAALLTGSLADFLFPLEYVLDERGARARGVVHRRGLSWGQVKRVVRDGRGVKLSPLARPSRLGAGRGIYLWFAGNEEDVMAAIARYTGLGAAGGEDGPGE